MSLTIEQILSTPRAITNEPAQWSPDGTSVLFGSSISGKPILSLVNASTGGAPLRIDLGKQPSMGPPRNPLWSPSGSFISFVAQIQGKDEVWLWQPPTALTSSDDLAMDSLDGRSAFQASNLGGKIHSMNWSSDGKHIAVSCNTHGSYQIYLIEIPSGKTVCLTTGPLYSVNPVFTPDNKHLLCVELDEKWENHDIVKLSLEEPGHTVILSDYDFFDYSHGKTFGYPSISRDSSTVLFRSQRSGFANLWTVKLNGGEPKHLCEAAIEQENGSWSPTSDQIVFTSNKNGTVTLSLYSGNIPVDLLSFDTGICVNPQWSPDGQHILFGYGTPTSPIDLWTISIASQECRQLTNSEAFPNSAQNLIAPEKIYYPTFDSLSIPAYLYSPQTKQTGSNYPAILLIHGGPTSQFVDDYQPYVQFFVEQGYVVLLPNIRGSSGYGKVFEELNNRDWGGDDLRDAIAGAEFLKTLDYVNPQSIGITGTSYGGILTMCAVSFAPGVFQAAVPMSGYSNWPMLRNVLELRHLRFLEHEFGPYDGNEDVWHRCSAFYKVADATTPTFVLHGTGRELWTETSQDFAVEMARLYKTVEYKVYDNDGFYVGNPANVKQMLIDIVGFFDRYLKSPSMAS